jgi:hypothetical protein
MMGIDYKAIAKRTISERQSNPVKERFDFLKENYDTHNLLEYTSFIQELPLRSVMENTQYIFSEPLHGSSFFNFFIESNYFTTDQLSHQREVLVEFLGKCDKSKYSNIEHLTSMRKTLEFIDTELSNREDMSCLLENLKYTYHMDKLLPVMESEVQDELDKLTNKVVKNPDNITMYEKFVNDLKKQKVVNIIKYFPLLLVKNTSIVLGLAGATVGTVAMSLGVAITVCLTIPPFIVASLIQNGIRKGSADSYIVIFDKQITMVRNRIKTETDPDRKKNISAYLDVLINAREELVRHTTNKNPIKESLDMIQEGAVLFIAPYVLPMPRRWIKTFLKTGWSVKESVITGDIDKMNSVSEIDKLIDNMEESKKFYATLKDSKTVEAKIIKFGVFNGVNAENSVRSIVELHDQSIELLKKRRAEVKRGKKYVKENSISDIVFESSGSTWDNYAYIEEEDDNDDDRDETYVKERSRETDDEDNYEVNLYSDTLYDIMDDPNSDLNRSIQSEIMENFVSFLSTEDEDMLESFNKLLYLGNVISYISEAREIVNAARKTKDFSDRVDTRVNKAVEPVNNFVSQTIDSVKKIDNRERRNRMIEGKFRFRLLKIIRNSVLLGGIWAINPAIAAITFLAGVALDAKADSKVREQILDELKEELRIVEEKIDDAKSDSERQKKYELMRIKNRLEKDIKRIEYRLDHAT